MVLLLLPVVFPGYSMQIASNRIETLQAVLFLRIPKRLNLNDAFVLFLAPPSGNIK